MKYITVIVLCIATLITIGCAIVIPYQACNKTVLVGYTNEDGTTKYVPENRLVSCDIVEVR